MAMSPLPDDCARQFRALREIAAGGFGTVWECDQFQLARRAAVKVLHAPAALEPDQVSRFLFEARVTAALSHPHVVVVYDHGAAAGVPWIASRRGRRGRRSRRGRRGRRSRRR